MKFILIATILSIQTLAFSIPVPTVALHVKGEPLADRLKTHLVPLKLQQLAITDFIDHESFGDEGANQLISQARMILLLMTPDILAEGYEKIEEAIQIHEREDAIVVPIFLRPTEIKGLPMDRLQALPRDAEPVVLWDDEDSAFLNVVQNLKRVAGVAVERFGLDQGDAE